MAQHPLRPPYDAELEQPFAALYTDAPALAARTLPAMRTAATGRNALAERAAEFDVDHHRIAGHRGGAIELSVVRAAGTRPAGPVLFHVHGGGMVMGDRWSGIGPFLDWAAEFDADLVTVEYRLAPEHPDPTPREDAYAALAWAAEHLAGSQPGPRPMYLLGQSAGGGIAASLALMARDRGGPALAGQLLLSPMLDDRNRSCSARQFERTGGWDRRANAFGWESLLGTGHQERELERHAAAARTEDLAGLAPTFLECGTAEVFRDETVAWAGRLWAAGNDAELHMWAGGFHRYDQLAPASALSEATRAARTGWLRRRLGGAAG
ncbi:Carboxylesterase NlhH [Arthrobacter saudimassiliensis]|uniref:Carboxylesterase NlhH n=1 Tax=Arthrobacter saudimassiliensis TaxID=1461584 RepID=A0A078MWS7_9MICC|nr:Carboxylesterase NlhH [Arthrobacter saudimassiliensis]